MCLRLFWTWRLVNESFRPRGNDRARGSSDFTKRFFYFSEYLKWNASPTKPIKIFEEIFDKNFVVIFESENSLGMDQDEIIQELPERLKEKARLELNETDENKHEAIEQLRVSVLWELRVWGTISISEIQISKVQNPFFEVNMFIKTKFISIKNDFFSKKYYLNYYAGIFQFRNFPIRIKRFVEIMNSLKIMTENKFWKILISRTKFLLSKISFFYWTDRIFG